MKWYKILLYNLVIAIILHMLVYMLVENSYCKGELHFLLQPFYPVYAIQPFKCEYKQVEPILNGIPDKSVIGIYYYFREHYMLKYNNRQPPFTIIVVNKTEYGTFKNSHDYVVKHMFLITTAREPPNRVLQSKSGDCDDYSAVLYIIYKLLNYDASLMLVKLKNKITGETLQHEVLIVKNNGKYYLIDSVNDFVVITNNSQELVPKYESALLYYTVENYWVFNDSLFPRKSLR